MSAEARWLAELEQPTDGFLEAFAARVAEPEGVRDATREALKVLIPRLDWEAYQPHLPHGVLGVRAVLRLRGLLTPASFLRALAVQLHMAAHEGRRNEAARQQALAAKGSGSWRNLSAYLASGRPGLAYAEAQGLEALDAEAFARLGEAVALDMANVGHKAVVADHLGDLWERLERPRATGRRLLGLAAWVAATPQDLFWSKRAAKRLGEAPPALAWRPPELSPADLEEGVRAVCDLGLVALLDGFSARIRAGICAPDLLAMLTLAAAEKQLDARRDLEGKTAWNFVYLATLSRAAVTDPRPWCQAAALVNLFPTDEPEDRVRPDVPELPDPLGLVEAILDAEPARALGHALGLAQGGAAEAALAGLAEAAAQNDPAFNHAHQTLAVAAAADLLPHLSQPVQVALLGALAKSLANSQGSGDLGRQADRHLARQD